MFLKNKGKTPISGVKCTSAHSSQMSPNTDHYKQEMFDVKDNCDVSVSHRMPMYPHSSKSLNLHSARYESK